jgi:hypothetical protein
MALFLYDTFEAGNVASGFKVPCENKFYCRNMNSVVRMHQNIRKI